MFITLWFCRLKIQGFILHAKMSLQSFDVIDELGSSALLGVLVLANH